MRDIQTSHLSPQPVRYRVGPTGLATLNRHLAPLGLQAASAWFDKNSILLSVQQGSSSATHEIFASTSHGPSPQPVRQTCVLVPCSGLEPGKPRPEREVPTAFALLVKELFLDALLQPADPTPHLATRLDRFFRNPMHASDWWKFHYPRSRLHGVESHLGSRYACIHHSTLECYRAYFRFLPSLDPFNDEPFRPPTPATNFATLITYQDVVAGHTQSGLEAAVQEAAAHDFDGILVRTTCLPDMVGDTPQRILRQVSAQSGKEAHWVAKTHPTPDVMARMLQQRIQSLLHRPPANGPREVLLAGVESLPLGQEMAQLLQPLDLHAGETLLPNLTLTRSDGAAPTGCIWVNPYGWNELLTDQLLPIMPVVRTFPPYGVEATRQWLLRIGSVLQIPNTEARIRPLFDSCQTELEKLKSETRRLPVALVGDASDLSVLSGRSPFSGFSVLALLLELGFPVTLLHRGEASLSTLPPLPPELPIMSFETPQELQNTLRSFALAYTDFNVDRRLLSSGVAGFGSGLVEPGIQGALRMARWLIHKAASRPFQHFRSRLSAAWRPES